MPKVAVRRPSPARENLRRHPIFPGAANLDESQRAMCSLRCTSRRTLRSRCQIESSMGPRRPTDSARLPAPPPGRPMSHEIAGRSSRPRQQCAAGAGDRPARPTTPQARPPAAKRRRTTEKNCPTTEEHRRTTENHRRTTEKSLRRARKAWRKAEKQRRTTKTRRRTTLERRRTTETPRRTTPEPRPTTRIHAGRYLPTPGEPGPRHRPPDWRRPAWFQQALGGGGPPDRAEPCAIGRFRGERREGDPDGGWSYLAGFGVGAPPATTRRLAARRRAERP